MCSTEKLLYPHGVPCLYDNLCFKIPLSRPFVPKGELILPQLAITQAGTHTSTPHKVYEYEYRTQGGHKQKVTI